MAHEAFLDRSIYHGGMEGLPGLRVIAENRGAWGRMRECSSALREAALLFYYDVKQRSIRVAWKLLEVADVTNLCTRITGETRAFIIPWKHQVQRVKDVLWAGPRKIRFCICMRQTSATLHSIPDVTRRTNSWRNKHVSGAQLQCAIISGKA